MAKLAQTLAELNATAAAPEPDRQMLFITAQIIRHRVSIALLLSQIEEDAPVARPYLAFTPGSALATGWR
ncbi:MAG: hypothetical protein ACXWG1_07770 [Usitatibacter sp.]